MHNVFKFQQAGIKFDEVPDSLRHFEPGGEVPFRLLSQETSEDVFSQSLAVEGEGGLRDFLFPLIPDEFGGGELVFLEGTSECDDLSVSSGAEEFCFCGGLFVGLDDVGFHIRDLFSEGCDVVDVRILVEDHVDFVSDDSGFS